MDERSAELLAELGHALRARDRELRAQLIAIGPNDPRFERLFRELVAIGQDLKRWRGAAPLRKGER